MTKKQMYEWKIAWWKNAGSMAFGEGVKNMADRMIKIYRSMMEALEDD